MGASGLKLLTATQFSGTRYVLDDAGSATASLTKVTIPALSATAATALVVPEVTTAASILTNVPAASAPYTAGWEGRIGLNSDSAANHDDWVLDSRSAITCLLDLQATAAVSLTVTFIVFVDGAEYSRVARAVNVTTGVATFGFLAPYSGVDQSVPYSSKISVAYYFTATNAAASANTISVLYGGANTSRVQGITGKLNATRSGTNSQTNTQAATRTTTTTRVASDLHPAVGDSAQRLRLFTRTSYQGDGDPPIINGTKRIAGTVYIRANGAPYTTGATVVLIRDRDGREVATTQSGADGTYSFVRDAADPETYTTRIKRQTVLGQVEEAVSQNGLVPV